MAHIEVAISLVAMLLSGIACVVSLMRIGWKRKAEGVLIEALAADTKYRLYLESQRKRLLQEQKQLHSLSQDRNLKQEEIEMRLKTLRTILSQMDKKFETIECRGGDDVKAALEQSSARGRLLYTEKLLEETERKIAAMVSAS